MGIVLAMTYSRRWLPYYEQRRVRGMWCAAMAERNSPFCSRICVSARQVLNRHPWAPPLMESRTSPGLASLRHHDAVIGCFLRGGLSMDMTAHAYAIVDSYVYGFTLQEANLPFGGEEEISDLADEIVAALPVDEYPHFVDFTSHQVLTPGYNFGKSFAFGLDLILDGLERAARQS